MSRHSLNCIQLAAAAAAAAHFEHSAKGQTRAFVYALGIRGNPTLRTRTGDLGICDSKIFGT